MLWESSQRGGGGREIKESEKAAPGRLFFRGFHRKRNAGFRCRHTGGIFYQEQVGCKRHVVDTKMSRFPSQLLI